MPDEPKPEPTVFPPIYLDPGKPADGTSWNTKLVLDAMLDDFVRGAGVPKEFFDNDQ